MLTRRLARFAALGLLLASCGTKEDEPGSDDGATTLGTDTAASNSVAPGTGVPATTGSDGQVATTGNPSIPVSADTSGAPLPGTTSGVTAVNPLESAPTAGTSSGSGSSSAGPVPPTSSSASVPDGTSGAGGTNNPAVDPPAGTGGSEATGSTDAGGAGGVPDAVGGAPNGAGGAAAGGNAHLDDGPRNPDATTLRDKYDGYFNIGAAVDGQSYNSHAAILTTHFNSVTSENDMKFASLQPQEGNFTWGPADQMVSWAQSNNIMVRGHALVWHRQTPDWVFQGTNNGSATKEQLLDRMQKHISTVLAHFKGKVQVWDVVNEAILPDGSFRTGEATEAIDRSAWYRILGEDYIAAAFRFAREADPDVKLFYNDYYNYIPVKWQATRDMLKGLIDAGVPIDGVGLQCHVNVEPSTDPTHQSYNQTIANMEDAIAAYGELGLEVQITEMDMSVYIGGHKYDPSEFYTVDTFTPEMQAAQAERYGAFFELFRRYRDTVSSVTFWGVADDNTWLSEFDSGRQDFPLLFDVNHDPKPAFDTVMAF